MLEPVFLKVAQGQWGSLGPPSTVLIVTYLDRARGRLDARISSDPNERSEALALVTKAIGVTVAGIPSVDSSGVSLAKTVADYGLDSLIAAELCSRFNLTSLDFSTCWTSPDAWRNWRAE